MSDDKKPWLPSFEELRRRPQWQIDAMETDPVESARDALDEFALMPFTFEDVQEWVTETAQKLDFVGHADHAAKLVEAVDELMRTINDARMALGPSPYVSPYGKENQ
jgi:hypothetical protein